MADRFVSDALEYKFLLSPILLSLIKNFSFKNDFLSFCDSLDLSGRTVLSWTDLRAFFEHNHWNWPAFLKSNLSTILFDFSFVLSSSIDPDSVPLQDLSELFPVLDHFSDSKIVFDSEMVSYLRSNTKNSAEPARSTDLSPQISSRSSPPKPLPVSDSPVRSKIDISKNISIWSINLPALFETISTSSYNALFQNRFFIMDKFFSKNYQELTNKPKLPVSSTNIEVNERIFITGIISNNALSSTDLYSSKIQLENFKLNCTIFASISIQQQSKIPLGMVISIIGRVLDISNHTNGKTVLTLSAENWSYPGFSAPVKKSIPKVTNESWIVVVGSLNNNHQSFSQKLLDNFSKWLLTGHDNFRIRYCVFIGGINSNRSVIHDSSIDFSNNSRKKTLSFDYSVFNSFLEKMPSNVEVFVLPSNTDLTNQFLPQPALVAAVQSSKKTVHYLQNPNILSIEDKTLLFYNPFQFFSFELFVKQPEKFGIDLLNYRHLAPVFDQGQNLTFPYTSDPLVLTDDIDFFVFHHPQQSILSAYKNINILSISANSDTTKESFPVLIFNLHTQEKKIITIHM